MRFLVRGLTGLFLGILSLALVLLAAAVVGRAVHDRAERERTAPPGQERLYAVNVVVPTPGTVTPVLAAYGEVLSVRSLQVRAGASGTLAALAPGFREGGAVEAGEVLYAIDPTDAEAALRTAEIDLEEAEAELAEAEAALPLARADRAASEAQRALRARALERQEGLQARRVGTAPELEAAELALSQAEQTAISRAQAEAQAEARVSRAQIALSRAEIARAQAERRLTETQATAPFDGVFSEVMAQPGAVVAANELLGTLVDPAALEVGFRITAAEFARLLDGAGRLPPLQVTARVRIGGDTVAVEGRLERSGAATGAGQAGRMLYAALDPVAPGLVVPGDFVEVVVEEPPLAGVALLPAAAVGPDGGVLVVGEGERLEAASVAVLRRQGDDVLVADAPWGREIVAARAAQLAPGLRVRPLREEPPEMVTLDPAMRASLIAAVEANPLLPEARRADLVLALQAETVPQSVIDQVNTETGG